MNLDLLIKLVKLANNNPSEHEANSAARRACKLIAEGNYDFGQPKTAQQKVNIKPQGSWTGFGGSYGGNPYADIEEMMREMQRQKQADADARRRAQQNTHEPGFGGYRPSDAQNAYYNYRPGRGFEGQEKKPKVRRDCSRCGINVETNSKAQVFVCSICLWKAYQESENAKKSQNDKV